MKYKEVFDEKKKNLENQEDLTYVFRHSKKLDQLQYINILQEEIKKEDISFIDEIAERLANYEPAQYIIGDVDFYNLPLKVDGRVLIPRPETEELVDLILKENQADDLQVIDVGTGSGAIGLALKKARPLWQLTLADISSDALNLAEENAYDNNLDVNFIQSDLLSNINEKYDIIVSNPPYIDVEEKPLMDKSVIDYEPDLALYADNQGLYLYEQIASQALDFLKDGGKIYLEIGFKQGKAVKAIFEKAFPQKYVRVVKDFQGLDRMVIVSEN